MSVRGMPPVAAKDRVIASIVECMSKTHPARDLCIKDVCVHALVSEPQQRCGVYFWTPGSVMSVADASLPNNDELAELLCAVDLSVSSGCYDLFQDTV